MELAETLFHNGQALGKIHQDLFKGVVTFKPKQGHTRLDGRKWKSVKECQRAVIKTYTKEDPRD